MNKTIDNEQHWKRLVLLLKKTASDKRISHAEIAEKTGLKTPNVSRVFSLKYCPGLNTFTSIADAIGVDVNLEKNK